MAARFWVGGTGTWDASTTTHWASSSNGAGGQSVPGSGDTVTFDANSGGGTVTVNTTVNVTSITCGAHTGTLDFATNDNNVTLQSFSGTGTGTRTLNMGDGTWTITGTGTVWNMLTVTNLTFNANGSTLKFTGATNARRTFTLNASLTYNNITIDSNTSGGTFLFNLASGGASIGGTLTINSSNTVVLPTLASHTIAALAINGTVDAPVMVKSQTDDTTATISVSSGSPAMHGVAFRDITCSGGATFIAQDSWDLGHNSGVTIIPPVAPGAPSIALGII